MSDAEKKAVRVLARTFTAWVIDVGRAISNGTVDDRIAALDQSEAVIDACDAVATAEQAY